MQKPGNSLICSVAVAISYVVGTGIFGISGMALTAGGPTNSILGWLVACAAMLPFLVIFYSLGKGIRGANGIPDYVGATFGANWGSAIRMLLLSSFIFLIPTVALIGASFLRQLFQLPEQSTPGLCIGVLVIGTVLNLLGKDWFRRLTKFSFYSLIGMLLWVIIANLDLLELGWQRFFSEQSAAHFSVSETWSVCVLLVLTLIGWENVSVGDNEKSQAGWVYSLSWVAVSAIYASLAFIVAGASHAEMPVYGIGGLYSLLQQTPGGSVLSVVAILLMLANSASWIRAASCLLVSAIRKGHFPRVFSAFDQRTVSPAALGGLFISYMAVLALDLSAQIEVKHVVGLITQNYCLIYMASILVYWKRSRGLRANLVIAAAMGSSLFLLAGFSWQVMFSLMLLGIGYVLKPVPKRTPFPFALG